MTPKVMTGIPAFVRITILSQTRRLLATSYFINSNDREDLMQDLLLFYLKKFADNINEVDEALVVASIKNYASNLLRSRLRQRPFLYASLDDLMANGHEDEFASSPVDNSLFESRKSLEVIMASLDEREQRILMMISDGFSLNEIARQIKISKNTIYKIFEKIRRNYEI